MSSISTGSSNLYALLIGIDYYIKNRLPNGSYYRNLKGCIRDVSQVEAFLTRQPQPPTQIFKLTASHPDRSEGLEPQEPKERRPTYENMVAALKAIAKAAQPGDQAYIYYSGHGGRARTIYPERKGSNGVDEALVPTDIGNSEARYLRDVELAQLIRDMVDKGLEVVVILDCCHSGGATRAEGCAVRGLDSDAIDETPRSTESLVASPEQLIQNWDILTDRVASEVPTRRGAAVAGILPDAKGYVLLAACRPSELAHEYAFEGKEYNGALTYWLLDTLNQPISGLTYEMLNDRIKAKVNSQFRSQNPVLIGEGTRLVFGKGLRARERTVTVIDIKVDENHQPTAVRLDAGQAQGLQRGAEFMLYSFGTVDFTQKEGRLAIATVTQRDGTRSWAAIKTLLKPDPPIQHGSPAVMTAAPVALVRKVGLLADNPLSGELEPVRRSALDAVQSAIAESGWVESISGEEAADYHVSVKAEGDRLMYEIGDASGEAISLRPSLEARDFNAGLVVKRLVHLAKYQAVAELDNHGARSSMRSRVSVKLLGWQAGYRAGDPIQPEPFSDPSQPIARVGDCVFLEVQNNDSTVLNVVVLDLQSDWAIDQIFPWDGDYFSLDPGEQETIPIELSLPDGEKQGSDVFKVFATLDAANFRWLELPALDNPIPTRSQKVAISGEPGNPLEQLLDAFSGDRPPFRKLNARSFSSREWTTVSLSVILTK